VPLVERPLQWIVECHARIVAPDKLRTDRHDRAELAENNLAFFHDDLLLLMLSISDLPSTNLVFNLLATTRYKTTVDVIDGTSDPAGIIRQ